MSEENVETTEVVAPKIADDIAEAIFDLSIRLGVAKETFTDLDGRRKRAKNELDGLMTELESAVYQARVGIGPLFGNAEEAASCEDVPAEGHWKDISIAELALSPKVEKALLEALLNTMGVLTTWMNDKSDWWAKDIPNLGPAGQKEIEDAMIRFWEKHPEAGEPNEEQDDEPQTGQEATKEDDERIQTDETQDEG